MHYQLDIEFDIANVVYKSPRPLTQEESEHLNEWLEVKVLEEILNADYRSYGKVGLTFWYLLDMDPTNDFEVNCEVSSRITRRKCE